MRTGTGIAIGIGLATIGIGAAFALAGRDKPDVPPKPPFSPDGRTRDFSTGLDVAHLVDVTPNVAAKLLQHVHRGDEHGVRVPLQSEYDLARRNKHPRFTQTFELTGGYGASADRFGLFRAAELSAQSDHDGHIDTTELTAFLREQFGAKIDAAEAAKIVAPSATWS